MKTTDFGLRWLKVRADFVLVTVATALVAGLVREDPIGGAVLGAALAVVIIIHELGHAAGAALVGRPFSVILQLTGGLAYLGPHDSRSKQAIILMSGPVAGVLSYALGALLVAQFPGGLWGYFGALLQSMAALWSVYQLLPFPPLDGGLLLRRVALVRWVSATTAWRLCWLFGAASALLIVALEPRLLESAVWLGGMTVILGRAEAGYVRHIDAFDAWERGAYKEVLKAVRDLPDYLHAQDRRALLELGVSAGIELRDVTAVEELAARLPAAHVSCVRAAEWLLISGRDFGARLADQAFDALDADQVKAEDIDRERWSDLAFRLAIHEADALKPGSALGLLERATRLGYDNVDRLEAEGAFEALHENPRWDRLIEFMRPGV